MAPRSRVQFRAGMRLTETCSSTVEPITVSPCTSPAYSPVPVSRCGSAQSAPMVFVSVVAVHAVGCSRAEKEHSKLGGRETPGMHNAGTWRIPLPTMTSKQSRTSSCPRLPALTSQTPPLSTAKRERTNIPTAVETAVTVNVAVAQWPCRVRRMFFARPFGTHHIRVKPTLRRSGCHVSHQTRSPWSRALSAPRMPPTVYTSDRIQQYRVLQSSRLSKPGFVWYLL